MKSKIVLFSLIFSALYLQCAFAGEEHDHSDNKAHEVKEEVVKKRRKKVQICSECGKPETQCDCEGHGKAHAHDDEHDHAHEVNE